MTLALWIFTEHFRPCYSGSPPASWRSADPVSPCTRLLRSLIKATVLFPSSLWICLFPRVWLEPAYYLLPAHWLTETHSLPLTLPRLSTLFCCWSSEVKPSGLRLVFILVFRVSADKESITDTKWVFELTTRFICLYVKMKSAPWGFLFTFCVTLESTTALENRILTLKLKTKTTIIFLVHFCLTSD